MGRREEIKEQLRVLQIELAGLEEREGVHKKLDGAVFKVNLLLEGDCVVVGYPRLHQGPYACDLPDWALVVDKVYLRKDGNVVTLEHRDDCLAAVRTTEDVRTLQAILALYREAVPFVRFETNAVETVSEFYKEHAALMQFRLCVDHLKDVI